MKRARRAPKPRVIWFVGGGLETVPGVLRAKELGLHVVVSDRNPKAPCFAHADETVLADTYDAKATLAAARLRTRERGAIHGVICLAVDVPYTAAILAAGLGLRGISPHAARLAMDKLAMKDAFAAHGTPIPWYTRVHDLGHLRRLQRDDKGPLIVKPVDSRGARGVVRLLPDTDPRWAFEQARDWSPSGRVLVERYLEGPQVSTESLMLDGTAHTPGFSDRNYELLERHAPFMVENGGDLPSFLSEEMQREIAELVGRGARAMGIREGVVKGDIVVHEDKPYIIELAARLSGGYFCTHEIPLNTGVDLVGLAIRHALGERIDPAELQPRFQRCVSQRYLFPEAGLVTAVEGVEEVAAREEIALCEVRVRPGDRVAKAENHPARAGVVIAVGSDREQARRHAESAVRDIHIQTE